MNRRTFCRLLGSAGGLTAALAGCVARRDPGGREGTDDQTGTPSPDSTPEQATTTDPEAIPEPVTWPTFGADDGHTGFRPEGTGPATGTVAWSAIGDAPTVLCSPAVAGGAAGDSSASDGGTVYVGSAADALHAFDARTGELQWEVSTTSYVETAPRVGDGRVYTADADGVVYAVTTDGEEVWRHETGQNLHSRALAVDDGTVYVGTAGDMPEVVSGDTDASRAGKVVALDADTGEEEWTFAGPEDWFSGPAVGDGRVYVGNHSGTVSALEGDTGDEVWTWSPSDEGADHAGVLAPPTYADRSASGDSSDGGTVYVGLHGAGWVVALDAASGDVRWRTTLEAENVKSSPAVTDQRVYVGSHRVRGVTLGESGDGTPSGTPTPEPGTYGKLYALSITDGSTDWIHETDYDFRSSPAVVGDRVYVGGGDGALAVTREDGNEVWRVTFDGFVDSSPAVAGGRAFIGSADGHLYCIGDG